MTVKLSRDSFVGLLTKSGLIKSAALDALMAEYQSDGGTGEEDGELFAQFLIRQGELTTWQARKLLLGKHKGFLLGKYRLLSLLGRGGMSSVYLADHIVMRRRCAIKVLPTKHVNDPAALSRFYQEAQAVAALDDPHIVRAYDVDQVLEGKTEIHFLVMEYVEGRSLQEVVDQDGPLRLVDAIDYICQAASGLDHAHQAGMVHRDIKPSNLLLDTSGIVKVLDMGLARFFEQTDQQSLTIQHDQRVLGTADYLSPEQAVDSHTVGTRSDIYCLGGTLYFLLLGHPPFPDGTLAQRLLAHQTKQPKPITQQRPDIPASFARIVERMMAKTPDERPDSAGEVRRELLEWRDKYGEHFAETGDSPVQSTLRKHADPTTAGWSDLPAPTSVTSASKSSQQTDTAESDSLVLGDPNLGEFLSGLSTDVDSARTDSEKLAGAKTVVSGGRPELIQENLTTSATADSGSSVHHKSGSSRRDSATLSRSGSEGPLKRPLAIPVPVWMAAAAALVLLTMGYFLWPSSSQPDREIIAANPGVLDPDPNPDGGGQVANDPGSQRPTVQLGPDITVGPEGHFATINEAIAYVQEHFQPLSRTAQQTILVAGGVTYAEAIEIDNSIFGDFPLGVSLICNDTEPAILAPEGSDPIVTLVNVERFCFEGFQLAGQGRPVAMRLEGYLVGSRFEKLTINDVDSAAINAVGVSGLNRRSVEFRDLLIHRLGSNAVGLSFSSGTNSTKELLLSTCRFAGPMQTGIAFSGEVGQIEISGCRFDHVTTPIQFLDARPFEGVTLVNNTFREFEHAVVFASLPKIDRQEITFLKNLFVGVQGPEIVVADTPAVDSTGSSVGPSGARYNWSEGTGELPSNGVDIFGNDGRRGIDPVTFVSTDVEQSGNFLKPRSPELRQAARSAPNPKYIGAVAPASTGN